MPDDTKAADQAATDAAKAQSEADARAAEAAAANKAREVAASADASTAPYVVAPGGSISCRRGIVDEGQPVSSADFVRGKEDLKDFIARGVVIKRG